MKKQRYFLSCKIMNKQIAKLHDIALKESRLIIGLMSGTSLDGLDIALCRCTGAGLTCSIELLAFTTISYTQDFRNEIKSVFSLRQVDLEKLCLLNGWVAEQHAAMILESLQAWNIEPEAIDLIASHGQTVYHAPKILHQREKFSNGTLQIGDGDHLAMRTGIITLSDFRQKHVAAGGEGAPLAVYGDYLVFGKKGVNRIMLNIGGIANFTCLPGSMDAGEVFSTDTGTGNTLMDAYVQKFFPGKYFDENASIAKNGRVNTALLEALMNHPFFEGNFPKTIGPELFNLTYLFDAMDASGTIGLSHEDVMATLNAFSAKTIADALLKTTENKGKFPVYVSGGGMHNPLLMDNLRSFLPGFTFNDTNALGINPDAKEAVLFAILANECLSGGVGGPGNTKQGIPAVSMGKISFPL
jgi:anhydro-N-acetylmuramic acid kinase